MRYLSVIIFEFCLWRILSAPWSVKWDDEYDADAWEEAEQWHHVRVVSDRVPFDWRTDL